MHHLYVMWPVSSDLALLVFISPTRLLSFFLAFLSCRKIMSSAGPLPPSLATSAALKDSSVKPISLKKFLRSFTSFFRVLAMTAAFNLLFWAKCTAMPIMWHTNTFWSSLVFTNLTSCCGASKFSAPLRPRPKSPLWISYISVNFSRIALRAATSRLLNGDSLKVSIDF